MPKKESLQHRIERVRPPRVNITYDVEVGGAIELKELPFVIGYEVENNKITAHWLFAHQMLLMEQLGVVKNQTTV